MKDIDKYVEEKAIRLIETFGYRFKGKFIPNHLKEAQDFIRSIIKDYQPKVSRAFIGKVTGRIYCDRKSSKAIKTHVREAFEEVGVGVEDEHISVLPGIGAIKVTK